MSTGSKTLPRRQIAHAADEPQKYSSALVFSTKYDPPSPIFSLGEASRALDEQYFGLHHDMTPEAIAQRLGGTLLWKREEQGMWIGLIKFNRQLDARGNGSGWDRACAAFAAGLLAPSYSSLRRNSKIT